ncbi:Beta-TrCP [Dactylellina cionopaga]|nr:Beta-TrCP [Dactylellina cionopaga]
MDEETIKLWDTAPGALEETLEGHISRVVFVVFLTLEDHGGTVFTFAFSSDAKHLSLIPDDYTYKLWDTTSGKLIQMLEGHVSLLLCLEFSPDSKQLASADRKATRLWNVASGTLIQIFEVHGLLIYHIAFSLDGK